MLRSWQTGKLTSVDPEREAGMWTPCLGAPLHFYSIKLSIKDKRFFKGKAEWN